MRRLLIFVGLGPALGLLTALDLVLPLFNGALGTGGGVDFHRFVLLPVAYFFGAVPALIAAAYDDSLAFRQVRRRSLWCGVFGFCISFLVFSPFWGLLALGLWRAPGLLAFGLVGAIPAIVCSWLSGSTASNWAPARR